MKNAKFVLGSLCLAALLGGLVFGFLPVTDMETSLKYFGDEVTCGSAFVKNDDGLTSVGKVSCEEAGLSRNRTIAIALIVVAFTLGIATLVIAASGGQERASSDGIDPSFGSSESDRPSLTTQVNELTEAHQAGLLSEDEYIEARRRLLGL